jgi:hypothetical protein
MNTMPHPADPDAEPDGEPPLSVGDPVLRKTRLLARECDTCIFRPGNLMHLAPGGLKQLVAEARDRAGYIICHSTLPAVDSPVPPAVCRGFADRYSTPQLQLMQRLWGFVEVPPPDPDPVAER